MIKDDSQAEGPGLDPGLVRALVAAALAEDVGAGDVTTGAVIEPEITGAGGIVARQALVVCGLALARETFLAIDSGLQWKASTRDGDAVEQGAEMASVRGRAGSILTAERTALNFLQRLCGIATLTHRAVEEIAGTGARILDTRKTTPTLRVLEKYAVRTGGGTNHRAGLFDAVLIKDNHIAIAGGVSEAIRRAHAAGHDPATLEVEVDDIGQVREALRSGAGRLLLDNFTVEQVAEAVLLIRRHSAHVTIEVSGGLTPGSLRAYAEAGADFLSLGRLTHSAPAADIALDLMLDAPTLRRTS